MKNSNEVSNPSFGENLGDYLVGLLVSNLPHLNLLNNFKAYLMRRRGAIIGNRVKFLVGIWIDRYSKLEIKDDVSLAKDITMVSSGGIEIGERVMVGYGTTILSASHRVPPDRGQMRFSGLIYNKVVIQNDVWIGAKVVILPGVTIGEGSVVGAGAVVTKDVSPFSIVAGVPAKLIRIRE
jgi:acetyltransferase-like isoleucine patch superfamily enzyme